MIMSIIATLLIHPPTGCVNEQAAQYCDGPIQPDGTWQRCMAMHDVSGYTKSNCYPLGNNIAPPIWSWNPTPNHIGDDTTAPPPPPVNLYCTNDIFAPGCPADSSIPPGFGLPNGGVPSGPFGIPG